MYSMEKQPFRHKKSLGQHFLTSDIVPKWLCEAANVESGDVVVEIGPGTGMLTRELLSRGAKVIALEADARAVASLAETFSDQQATGQLLVEHTDVRTIDLHHYSLQPGGYKVVANIPYYLSGHLFRSFLETDPQPNTLVFLVQKEVAKRICVDLARGEKESILSLSVKVYGTPRYVRTVGRGHFNPPPKVDSAVIAVSQISKQAFIGHSEATFFELLHLGFGQKRKQLIGNLAARYDRATLIHLFSTLNLEATVRAEDVPLGTWLKSTNALAAHT